MIAAARIAAYEAVTAIAAGRGDLPTALAHARETLHDERDRALAAEIITGVQRWRGLLDHLIAHAVTRPFARLDHEVISILRLSIYQLLYLTRVPASAVVDDAVNLARKLGKSSARGLVNAVLRSISRRRNALPLPPRPHDESDRQAVLDYLSISLSHPEWLASRWYDRLGFQRAEAWMRFNNQVAPLTLRANRMRATVAEAQAHLLAGGVTTERGRFAPDALVVRSGHPLRDPGMASGLFVVQDEASQLVALLAGEHPGPLVLDACASPGGKATAIAAQLTAGNLLVACDVRARRIGLLRRTIALTGVENVRVVQADLLRPLPFGRVFSCVIVDAPCSGLGTLRRDPDLRWRRQADDLPALARAQLQMLDHAQEVVAPGGRMIYATCSSEPEENEQVIDDVRDRWPAFHSIHAATAHPALTETADARGHLRTSPDEHGLEMFFGAVFERTRDL